MDYEKVGKILLCRLSVLPTSSLSRMAKISIVLSVDTCLCILSTWLAFYLRLDEFVKINNDLVRPAFLSIFLALPIFAAMGLYKTIFRYSGWPVILAVGRATMLYGLIYMTVVMAVGLDGTPRTVGVIQPLLLFFAVGGSRLVAPFLLGAIHRSRRRNDVLPRVLIYGAGAAGRRLAAALSNGCEMVVVGFLDDNSQFHNYVINGFRVFSPEDLPKIIASEDLTYILLAMPSVSRVRRNAILKTLSLHRVIVRTVPSMEELAEGRVTISDVKDLDIDDLLGREPVKPNFRLLTKNVSGRTILVTGAGGSIGSELCRQIVRLRPDKILLVEISEYALYKIHSELECLLHAIESEACCRLIPLLASVQDEARMRQIMDIWRPETVYHAAAYKHVPLVEHNSMEGVKNNVIGTLTLAQLAIEAHVSDFVLISTDKAVRPTNVMGASKRMAELCLQALSANAIQDKAASGQSGVTPESASKQLRTNLSIVRFGNVLDSSGSVIPKFREQIRSGSPITVTHSEITRYFMTIPEAAQLVIQASAMASGGDVFVLDMGEPVRIVDLARRMITLSGMTVRDEDSPEGDIEIVVTGLRAGEKLYEELLVGDSPCSTQHSKIVRARDPFMPWHELEHHLNTLRIALSNDDVELTRSVMQRVVVGFKPSTKPSDWIYVERSGLAESTRDRKSHL